MLLICFGLGVLGFCLYKVYYIGYETGWEDSRRYLERAIKITIDKLNSSEGRHFK